MTEVITVSEVVSRLRLDSSSPVPESEDITAMIVAARVAAENFLNRTIVERQRILVLDVFVTVIKLSDGDVSSINSISYVDTTGGASTVTEFILSENRLTAAYGADWPTARAQLGAVTITYTAGYTPVGSPAVAPVPDNIMQAMFLMIGDMYDNREAISQGVEYRINPSTENLLFPSRIDLGV